MMTDAPERIWTWIDYDGNWDGTWLSDSKALQPERLPDAQYVHRDLYDAQAARIAELEAALRETLIEVDKLGNHCVGCGHMCGDPEKDLAMIRKAGGISCCPERKMEPISATLAAMVPALTALKGATNDT